MSKGREKTKSNIHINDYRSRGYHAYTTKLNASPSPPLSPLSHSVTLSPPHISVFDGILEHSCSMDGVFHIVMY